MRANPAIQKSSHEIKKRLDRQQKSMVMTWQAIRVILIVTPQHFPIYVTLMKVLEILR